MLLRSGNLGWMGADTRYSTLNHPPFDVNPGIRNEKSSILRSTPISRQSTLSSGFPPDEDLVFMRVLPWSVAIPVILVDAALAPLPNPGGAPRRFIFGFVVWGFPGKSPTLPNSLATACVLIAQVSLTFFSSVVPYNSSGVVSPVLMMSIARLSASCIVRSTWLSGRPFFSKTTFPFFIVPRLMAGLDPVG